MRNIELKVLYWESDPDKRIEIKKTLLNRENKQYRIRQGNVDLLINVIYPINEDDEKIAIMVNGIFTLSELENRGIVI